MARVAQFRRTFDYRRMASDSDDIQPHKPTDLASVIADLPENERDAFVDLMSPGLNVLLARLRDDFRETIEAATQKFDPMAVSALRSVHAILVAARRKDERTLRDWENLTFKYMKAHALDEYLQVPLPPRPGLGLKDRHDRHLIVAALRDRIVQYLRLRDREPFVPHAGQLEKLTNETAVTLRLQTMVGTAFPDLSQATVESKQLLSTRIETHMATGRPLAKLDPEAIILDALMDLGLTRLKARNWLRALK